MYDFERKAHELADAFGDEYREAADLFGRLGALANDFLQGRRTRARRRLNRAVGGRW